MACARFPSSQCRSKAFASLSLALALALALVGCSIRTRNGDRDALYVVLGVEEGATLPEIKEAYRKLSLKWHPDRHQTAKNFAQEKFIGIAQAYEVLSKVKSRAVYDAYGMDGIINGWGADVKSSRAKPAREKPADTKPKTQKRQRSSKVNMQGKQREDTMQGKQRQDGTRFGKGMGKAARRIFKGSILNEIAISPEVWRETIARDLKSRNVIVVFYSPDSPVCHLRKMDLRKFVEVVHASGGIRIGVVNCAKHHDLCARRLARLDGSVNDLPVVSYFGPHDSAPVVYSAGTISFEGLSDWSSEVVADYSHLLVDGASVRQWLASSDGLPKLIVFSARAGAGGLLKALSVEFADSVSIGVVPSDAEGSRAIRRRFRVTEVPAAIHVLDDGMWDGRRYPLGGFTRDALVQWLGETVRRHESQTDPLVKELTPARLVDGAPSGCSPSDRHYCLILASLPGKGGVAARAALTPAARKLQGTQVPVAFFFAPKRLGRVFGLPLGGVILYRPGRGRYEAYNGDAANSNEIVSFVRSIVDAGVPLANMLDSPLNADSFAEDGTSDARQTTNMGVSRFTIETFPASSSQGRYEDVLQGDLRRSEDFDLSDNATGGDCCEADPQSDIKIATVLEVKGASNSGSMSQHGVVSDIKAAGDTFFSLGVLGFTDLSDETWQEMIEEHADQRSTFVFAYVNSMRSSMMGILQQFAEAFALPGLFEVATLDCEKYTSLCNRELSAIASISFPAIFYYGPEGAEPEVYPNPSITFASLSHWSLQIVADYCSVLRSNAEVREWVAAGDLRSKFILLSSQSFSLQLFKSLSVKFLNRASFGIISSEAEQDVIDHFSAASPFRMLRITDESALTGPHYEAEEFSFEPVSRWLSSQVSLQRASADPTVREFTKSRVDDGECSCSDPHYCLLSISAVGEPRAPLMTVAQQLKVVGVKVFFSHQISIGSSFGLPAGGTVLLHPSHQRFKVFPGDASSVEDLVSFAGDTIGTGVPLPDVLCSLQGIVDTHLMDKGARADAQAADSRQTPGAADAMSWISQQGAGELVASLATEHEVRTWLAESGVGVPNVLLLSRASAPPPLLRALSLEFRGRVSFGVVLAGTEVALDRRLGVAGEPSLLHILDAETLSGYRLPLGEFSREMVAQWLTFALGHHQLSARG